MLKYSIYEQILSSLSIICSFGVREEYSDELIKENWIKLQKNYPYLYNYETIEDKSDNIYSDNIPLKYEFQYKGNFMNEYLNEIISFLSKESLKQEKLTQKNSLLAYAKIQVKENQIYTFFSLYTPHSRTDFKSLSFIVTSYLNNFDNISLIYPMESMGQILIEKNLIPKVEERQDLIKKYFNYKQILKIDFTKLKENIKLTKEEEKKMIKNNEIDEQIQIPYLISETIKISKEEMNIIFESCKKNALSVQALFYASYLKASLDLFQSNQTEADVVNFQIIYDQRKHTVHKEKCIGLFAEATYPFLSIDTINKSIIDISKELTQYIKKVTSLENEEFKRYRIECYYIHKELYAINFSLSATNMGKFKILEELSEHIKENFIDYHFLNGLRFPITNDFKKTEIHMYSLFDESCNISMNFPKYVIPSIYIIKLLNKIKENMICLEK